jgi:hypothetical protein
VAEQLSGGPRRVDATGLAVVHEGELIVPDVGSEAELMQAINDPRVVVEFHFPVVVEVRAADPIDLDVVAQHTLTTLARGLAG